MSLCHPISCKFRSVEGNRDAAIRSDDSVNQPAGYAHQLPRDLRIVHQSDVGGSSCGVTSPASN